MKNSRSQTKVLFAYQTLERDGYAANPGLNENSTNKVIRVVQYLNLGAYYNADDFADDSAGRGSLKTDLLVSAILVSRTDTPKLSSKDTEVYGIPSGTIQKIVPCIYKNYRIVDIVINESSALNSSIPATDSLTGVLIGLQFDSGATDDLFLTLVPNPIITVDLDSTDTQNAANIFGPLNDTGSVGSIKLNTAGNVSGTDTYFSAFSWAKYYKVITEGQLSLPATNRNPSAALNGEHFPFQTGWGIATGTPLGSPSGQQWAQSAGWYASEEVNVFTWITGKSDLTKSIWEEGEDISLIEEAQCTEENNPLGRFFGISPAFKNDKHTARGSGAVSFSHSETNTSWGQHFGWLCLVPRVGITKSFRGYNAVQALSASPYGTPPLFKRDVNPGQIMGSLQTGQGGIGSGEGQGLDNPTSFSKSMFGSFPSGSLSYREAGDSEPSFGAGSNAIPIAPTAGTSLNPANQDTFYGKDPLKRRLSRISYNVPGAGNNSTPVMSGYQGTLGNFANHTQCWDKFQASVATSSYYSNYVTNVDKEIPYTGYAWLSCRTSNVFSGAISTENSLREIRMTRGRNFFYTGGTQISADTEAYPVFKGHGKVMKLIRAGGFGSPNISTLAFQVASQHLTADAGGTPLEDPYVRVRDIREACKVDSDNPNKKFNGIELLMNMTWRGFNYPDALENYGFGVRQVSMGKTEQIADLAIRSYHEVTDMAVGGINYGDDASNPMRMQCQDIAYLVEGFNRINIDHNSNYANAAYSLNHPAESAWEDKSLMTNNSDIYSDVGPSVNRPFQIGPGVVTSMSENAGLKAGAIYSATPMGSFLTNQPLSIGIGANFSQPYSSSVYNFGTTSEDYPSNVPSNNPSGINMPDQNTAVRPTTIVNSSNKGIVNILNQSVIVRNSTGPNDTDTGFPSASNNNQNLEIEFVMRYQYTDQATTQFQTSVGDRDVTTADVPALADRVTKVLQIWNHIEVRPLSRLSDDATQDPLGVNGEPSFAYTQVIASDSDVDDIFIEQETGEDEVYILRMRIRANGNDVYNNPDYSIGAEDAAFTAIIPDVAYDDTEDYRAGTPSHWSTGYGTSDTDVDNGSSKASFIVVAHAATWEDTDPVAVVNDVELNGVGAVIGPRDDAYVVQTPYVTYGSFTPPSVAEPVPGCTDSNATNFNSDADVDDGSCIYCGTELIGTFDENSIHSGWKLGAYQLNGDHHMHAGEVADLGTVISGLPATVAGNSYVGSAQQNEGGVVMCNNAFVGQSALCNLSIKTAPNTNNNAFTSALQFIVDTYGEQAPGNCWTLKIYSFTEAMNTDVPFTSSGTLQGILSLDDVPTSIAAASPIFTGQANAGSLNSPRWDNIAEESTAAFSGALKAGLPYVMEMIFDPDKISNTECAAFLAKKYRMYGMFWTAFCGCHLPSNDYFSTGLAGINYDWNGDNNFPILPYIPTSDCPEAVPGDPFGDGPYYGDDPTNINATVCYRADDELEDCDSYWLACVVGPDITCYDIDDIDSGTVQPILINAETQEYQFPFQASVEINVEGVYNAASNSLEVLDSIQYIATVTNGTDYTEEQTHADSIQEGLYVNEFDGITEPGTYTVTIVLTNPYPDTLPTGHPCTFEQTILIENNCAGYIVGCTDATAENYDPNATVPSGNCNYDDGCDEVYLNAALDGYSVTSTQSTSTCAVDTITFEGITYDINIPVPNNDGTVTVTVDYEETLGAISGYAIALVSQTSPLVGILDTQVDVLAAVFENYPGPEDINGVILPGEGSYVAQWSPLFVIGIVDDPNTHIFENVPPGNYYVLVVPDIQSESLDEAYLECEGQPFIKFEDYLRGINVGMENVLCEEDCLVPPCNNWTYGCTDPKADNYDDTADYDDGSCEYPETYCEQNPNDPLCDDCTSANEEGAQARGVGSRQTSGRLDETICDPTVGTDGECTDPNACNYNPNAPLDVSNNLLCDYCSCIEDQEDPDCFPDTGCDPALDPNCGPPQPECPDPGNPLCDPQPPFDPCPTSADCIPPGNPCLLLGNCPEPGVIDPEEFPEFIDDINPVEVTCLVDIDSVDGTELGFSAVQSMAFECMGSEGSKLLFKLKSGVECSNEELTKLSLIAYLFAGGLERTLLPCLFNCNYDSQTKLKQNNCIANWVAGGARKWNGTDTFRVGDSVLHHHLRNGVVTRSYYYATREIGPTDPHPRYPGSGWKRCQDVTIRKADGNGIADGTENYLTVMYEYLTRYCTSCQVGTNKSNASYSNQGDTVEIQNDVDTQSMTGYLNPKINKENKNFGSGLIGEDGEEIIF